MTLGNGGGEPIFKRHHRPALNDADARCVYPSKAYSHQVKGKKIKELAEKIKE